MTQVQIEQALRSKLDSRARGLEQRRMYEAELSGRRDAVRPPPAGAVASTFGGLNPRKSPEMALEAALRNELNSGVRSQENAIYRAEAGSLLH
mmetsp:Transcript_21442/g.45043  ORF Transcript_21442/g.45043 Transcript_21442/m.45043 type:complete len:93 (+) Transcript_21442:3-281(+)